VISLNSEGRMLLSVEFLRASWNLDAKPSSHKCQLRHVKQLERVCCAQ